MATPLLDTVLHTLSLLGEPVMRSTLLLFLYSGFSNGFWSGVLTEQLSTDSIGLAMVVVGIAEVLGGLCYGKLVVSCAAARVSGIARRTASQKQVLKIRLVANSNTSTVYAHRIAAGSNKLSVWYCCRTFLH
jgi:hypothetical protein